MNTVPGGGFRSRGNRLSSVDLPEPVAPTIAVVVPAGTVKETSSRTRARRKRTSGGGTPRRRGWPARHESPRRGASRRKWSGTASMTSSMPLPRGGAALHRFVTQPNAIIGHASIIR